MNASTTRRNFFQQMLVRSLANAHESIHDTSEFSLDLRDRVICALDGSDKVRLTPSIWEKKRVLVVDVSPRMEQGGYWDKWIPYLDRALEMSQRLVDRWAEAAIGIKIGVFRFRQGELQKARDLYHTGVEIAQEIDDKLIQIEALHRLGFLEAEQYHVGEAEAYVEQAQPLVDEGSLEEAYALLIMGNIHLSLHESEKANEYFQISLELCRKHGDTHSAGIRLIGVGISLAQQGMHQEALDTYKKVVKIFMEFKDPVELAITQMNQGNTHGRLGDISTAIDHLKEAKQTLEKVSNSGTLAKLYNNHGYAYFLSEQWNKAEEMYNASVIQWQQLENQVSYADSLDGLAMVYVKQGRLKEAISIFEDALQILSALPDKRVCTSLMKQITEHLELTYDELFIKN